MRNNNDEKYIKLITSFYRKNRRIPTYAELMEITGYSSRASVFGLIERLISRNIFQKDSSGRLSPTKQFVSGLFERPKLGIVEAGFGYDADTIADDSHAIDEYLIDKPEATFLLTVKGESMIEAGIRPGDIIVAERGSEAKNGDIIIAEVDGAWTMKYYRNDGGKITLIPANRTIKPYSPKESFTISAVVKGVVRKYK
jgi:SOS regulatory protein LexA